MAQKSSFNCEHTQESFEELDIFSKLYNSYDNWLLMFTCLIDVYILFYLLKYNLSKEN